MDTAPEVTPEPSAEAIVEPIAAPQPARAVPKKQAAPERKLDKYSAARYAKKKQRRRAHRAVIARSNTNG